MKTVLEVHMDFLSEIESYNNKLKDALDKIDKVQINLFAKVLLKHYAAGSHIFIFGNGGSGMTASHTVCDFNKGVCLDLERKFKFICLNDNIGSMLAYGNDVSYSDIFHLQLKNFLTPKDLVIGISGSGNSENVIRAINYAKEMESDTFALCGFSGGKLKGIDSTNCIHVPIHDMQIVEDCHMIIFHMLMQIVYKYLHR